MVRSGAGAARRLPRRRPASRWTVDMRLVIAAVALLAFVIGRAGTAVLVTVIVAAAAFELFEGFRRAGFQPATLLALP